MQIEPYKCTVGASRVLKLVTHWIGMLPIKFQLIMT